MEKLYCNVDAIEVDKGDHCVRFVRGQELVDVPPGTIVSMLRLGQAVATQPPIDTVVQPNIETSLDWKLTAISSLAINKNAKAAFAEAGLVTVADALKYGAENDGLQAINGIGKASEEEFQAAVLAIQPKG